MKGKLAALVPVLGLLIGCPAATVPVVLAAPEPAVAALVPDAARASLVDALSSGRPEPVWAVLAPGPRSQFASEAAFSVWCKRYCADWLVMVLASDEEPVRVVTYGDVRLRESDGDYEVIDGPHLPARRDALGVVEALKGTLLRLANDPTFGAAQRQAWQRFADGLARALATTPPTLKSGVPFTVDGGALELKVDADGGWSVASFRTVP